MLSNSLSKLYHPFPKWREVRKNLVKEVHGKCVEVVEWVPQNNKVSSREKSVRKKLLTRQQLDDQKYHDFLLACDGFNTVSFAYNEESEQWVFNSANFDAPKGDNANNNLLDGSEYNVFVAELLTKIHSIKRNSKQNAHFGRCIAFLADEVNCFLSGEFKRMLYEMHENPDVTKPLMQSIYLAFNESIGLLEKFYSNVYVLCAVGGFLLNLIKKERDSLNKCYQCCFHDILTRAYQRGMGFFMQVLGDWMNSNDLDSDLFYEFFIWDASKRRFSNSIGQPESLVVEFDEPIFLKSLNPSNFYSLIDVKTFKRRYLIVPEMCPVEFSESLQQDVIKIGLYNHVLMLENKATFDDEFKKSVIERLAFENIPKLPTLVKNRHRHGGRVILRHLRNQLEFTILLEKLPSYFCGIKNSIIDDFVELTEEFDVTALSRQQNVKLVQLNRLYQRAIQKSYLADDSLSRMISLEFSVLGQVDSSHPPVANQSATDRPLNDLEPVLFCKDAFRLAFPPTIFALYQNFFRLRHALRRTLILLKEKFFSCRHELPRLEVNALSLMIRFVQSYDNFIFGYKASKLIHEYLTLVEEGINKNTLDLDTFLEKQEQMLNKLHGAAFVSSNPESFSNPMWTILVRLLGYARGNNDFKSTSIQICRSLTRIKCFMRAQKDEGRVLPELAEWLFGRNINSSTHKDYGFRLCDELKKSYTIHDTPTK